MNDVTNETVSWELPAGEQGTGIVPQAELEAEYERLKIAEKSS